jgi:uncharacterized SAM-binding protein YcdF (DUF218 family)
MPTDLSPYKPWLTALALPPASLLLLVLLGYLLVSRSERVLWRATGKLCFMTAFVLLWLACTQGAAIWLERVALRPPLALEPQAVTQTFKIDQVQAIVVLGGGMQSASREYGKANLSDSSAQRLHYGAMLARQNNLPLAFSGGTGWAAANTSDTEAAAAQRWLDAMGLPKLLRWQDAQSRDTAGNAKSMAEILKKDGIKSIVLVTSATHMPRALREFQTTELKITPAPTNFLEAEQGMGLDWFPSGRGARHVRQVAHEILGLAMMEKPQAQ